MQYWWVRWAGFMTDVKRGSGRGCVENIKSMILKYEAVAWTLMGPSEASWDFLGLAISSALLTCFEDLFENTK